MAVEIRAMVTGLIAIVAKDSRQRELESKHALLIFILGYRSSTLEHADRFQTSKTIGLEMSNEPASNRFSLVYWHEK